MKIKRQKLGGIRGGILEKKKEEGREPKKDNMFCQDRTKG